MKKRIVLFLLIGFASSPLQAVWYNPFSWSKQTIKQALCKTLFAGSLYTLSKETPIDCALGVIPAHGLSLHATSFTLLNLIRKGVSSAFQRARKGTYDFLISHPKLFFAVSGTAAVFCIGLTIYEAWRKQLTRWNEKQKRINLQVESAQKQHPHNHFRDLVLPQLLESVNLKEEIRRLEKELLELKKQTEALDRLKNSIKESEKSQQQATKLKNEQQQNNKKQKECFLEKKQATRTKKNVATKKLEPNNSKTFQELPLTLYTPQKKNSACIFFKDYLQNKLIHLLNEEYPLNPETECWNRHNLLLAQQQHIQNYFGHSVLPQVVEYTKLKHEIKLLEKELLELNKRTEELDRLKNSIKESEKSQQQAIKLKDKQKQNNKKQKELFLEKKQLAPRTTKKIDTKQPGKKKTEPFQNLPLTLYTPQKKISACIFFKDYLQNKLIHLLNEANPLNPEREYWNRHNLLLAQQQYERMHITALQALIHSQKEMQNYRAKKKHETSVSKKLKPSFAKEDKPEHIRSVFDFYEQEKQKSKPITPVILKTSLKNLLIAHQKTNINKWSERSLVIRILLKQYLEPILKKLQQTEHISSKILQTIHLKNFWETLKKGHAQSREKINCIRVMTYIKSLFALNEDLMQRNIHDLNTPCKIIAAYTQLALTNEPIRKLLLEELCANKENAYIKHIKKLLRKK